MGYNTNPGMVIDNEDILNTILAAITLGRAVKFNVTTGVNISSEQYRLRRILAATDNHQLALDGRFARLGSLCTIRVLFDEHQLLILPRGQTKGPTPLSLSHAKTTELDIPSMLADFPGSMQVIEFTPSSDFNLPQFKEDLSKLGWILHTTTRTEDDDGIVSFAVERSEPEEARGFGALGLSQEP